MTSSSSTSTPAPYGLLLLLLILSTLLLWVSVVALSPAEGAAKPKMTTMTATTDALQQQFTAKPGEARSEDSHSNSIENSTVSEAALKPEETFHRGSVLAAFDKVFDKAAFADGWVEVDEAENVGEEILGGHLGEAHHHLHHHHHHRPPHSHLPKFASIEDDASLQHQQSYECVLMPKLRPTYSEANTAEVVDDLINAGHHQVHHLYGVDVEEVDDGDDDGNGFHHPHSRHHKKATKRRAKSASSVSASTSSSSSSSSSASKLRDFGNFLYVDDTARPSYTSLESMEFASSSSSSPPPSSKHQKTKRGHRKASSLTKKSSSSSSGGSDSGSQELDQLFSSLKSSLDQLLCYQNEECYGGEMGGEGLRGREGEEKLEAFIRHVRASKKVFELLERNRHRLMEVAGGGGGGDGSKEMMAVAPHPEPGRIAEPGGPHLHLPHRFMAFDPMRELIGFGGGGPVAPMYDDTVQRSMAVKAPPSLYRKLMKSGGLGRQSVGKCKWGNGWFN